MKTKPQGRLQDTVFGKILQHPVAVMLSNWVFQGMRYMGLYEIIIKLGLDLLFIVLFMFLTNMEPSIIVLLSLLLFVHTLNWLFNGHFFVLMRYVAPVPKTEEQFEDFVEYLTDFAERRASIDSVVIYGSYCRGQLHKFSDLDARVLTVPGILNGFSGAMWCVYLRCVAFFQAFPLDIYCYRNLLFRHGLSAEEKPVVLLDRTGRISNLYKAE